jgi:hypothetical protein
LLTAPFYPEIYFSTLILALLDELFSPILCMELLKREIIFADHLLINKGMHCAIFFTAPIITEPSRGDMLTNT